MIILMETINSMIREISIEDWGHPYFVYTDEHSHLFENDHFLDISSQTSILIPDRDGKKRFNKSNAEIASFHNLQELTDFVINTDKIPNAYKHAFLTQLSKAI